MSLFLFFFQDLPGTSQRAKPKKFVSRMRVEPSEMPNVTPATPSPTPLTRVTVETGIEKKKTSETPQSSKPVVNEPIAGPNNAADEKSVNSAAAYVCLYLSLSWNTCLLFVVVI